MTDHLQDTRNRKDGGPADRLDWLTYQLLDRLTGNEIKALIPMVRDSNERGYLWSSYTRLQRMAGLKRTAWFERERD